jgi:cation diffusion facilitator CzcD-associated flavoprotein CzcO
MLQRTPGYLVSVPQFNPVLRILFKFMPKMTAYNISRSVMNFITQGIFKLSRKYPNFVRKLILKGVKLQVGPDFDMKHFTPPYKPWDQRLCAVPDGDMFKAISSGKASVVTDHIDRFVEDGILLKSGKLEKADIIVTATGLNLRLYGGMRIEVDGEPVDIAKRITYKGMMLNDVPNFSNSMGYTNASWTLKTDLIAEYVCRLITHMDKTGTRIAVAKRDSHVKEAPFMDLTSGFIARAEHLLPKGADREPWKIHQNYAMDKKLLFNGKLVDGVMMFSNPHLTEQLNATVLTN